MLTVLTVLTGLLALAAPADASPTRTGPRLGWTTNTTSEFTATAQALHLQPAAASTYASFTDPFPTGWADLARARSIPLVIGWEPWDTRQTIAEQSEYSLASIATGTHDAYVRAWARDAAASNVTVLLRFAPEFNGDWQPWFVHGTPRDFQNAWRHLHAVFAEEHATNVRWVFNPNITWEGDPVVVEDYWPGTRYVDWLALDGYNWEGVLPGRSYESAAAVFTTSTRALRALAPRLPFMFAEAASSPPSKTRWIRSLARTAPALHINLVIWFEHDKETDWQLTSAHLTTPLPALLRQHGWQIT